MGRVFEAFFYNERSSLDLGLKIEWKSILNGPEPDLQEYEIPGRDGKVYLSNRRRRSASGQGLFLRRSLLQRISKCQMSVLRKS